MPITIATVRKARLFPELIPDAQFNDIAAGAEASPPFLDLRRVSPAIVHLTNIGTVQDAELETRVRADSFQLYTTAAARDIDTTDGFYSAKNNLYFNIYNSSGSQKSNVQLYYGLWVQSPTVAHKIKHGIKLSDREQIIARDLNIEESVQKGILPLPLSYQVAREYQVIHEATYTYRTDLIAGETSVLANVVPPDRDTFLVLTGISAMAGTPANNIEVKVNRDNDVDYIDLKTYPLTRTREVKAFVPALNEIVVKAVASEDVSNFDVKFTVLVCKLTNIIRVRFGLIGESEAPGDLWKKVMGGVL